jgi:RNA polymerase sigma factor (sigma-70 family)
MQLSDADLICAAQSDGENRDPSRQELPIRFKALLFYFAGRACQLYKLDAGEAAEIVQLALMALTDPDTARFDAVRAEGRVEPYLRGLVQNAARTHARFLCKGAARRHDYADPENARRKLPMSVDGITDTRENRQAVVESRDLAVAVLAMATADERLLIARVFYRGESVEEVAVSLGVDRSTVSRRLTRFYRRVRARGWLFYAASHRCPN